MSIYNGQSSDGVLNGYLSMIRGAEYGRDARSPIAMAVQRCYEIANERISSQHNVPQSAITEHTNRIRNAVFGEEVRDALKMGLQVVYAAAGVSIPNIENNYFNEMIDARTGEDLKNGILHSIIRCCQDVS